MELVSTAELMGVAVDLTQFTAWFQTMLPVFQPVICAQHEITLLFSVIFTVRYIERHTARKLWE